MKNSELFELSRQTSLSAFNVLKELDIAACCQTIGAAVNIVGSLKTGLMMNRPDIDLHIYTDEPMIKKSFSFINKISKNQGIKEIQYKNLLDTKEECLEWHLWYEAADKNVWKLDIIHIRKGSYYDGFFEKIAGRIIQKLTPETRETILRIKYALGEKSDVPGIQIYYAVMEQGIKTYPAFLEWSAQNPAGQIWEWIP